MIFFNDFGLLQGTQGVVISHTQHYQPGQGTVSGMMPTIVPDEEDLPGWVPKNYIEKGMSSGVYDDVFYFRLIYDVFIFLQLLLFTIIMRIKKTSCLFKRALSFMC